MYLRINVIFYKGRMRSVRKVIVSEMLSIEGFMEEERGQLDWFVQDVVK
jgi:hypothetical protein